MHMRRHGEQGPNRQERNLSRKITFDNKGFPETSLKNGAGQNYKESLIQAGTFVLKGTISIC